MRMEVIMKMAELLPLKAYSFSDSVLLFLFAVLLSNIQIR